MTRKRKSIGIDFGTTKICIAEIINSNNPTPKIILNDRKQKITPSYMCVTEEDEIIIGEDAIEHMAKSPREVVYDIKQIIGKKFDDPAIQTLKDSSKFEIVSVNGDAALKIGDQVYSIDVLLSKLFQKLKRMVVNNTEELEAVIAIPINFNKKQRDIIKKAGLIAGLNIIDFIEEPIAAALAYDLGQHSQNRRDILVFDLSAKSCNITVLSVENGQYNIVKVEEYCIGGNEFTKKLEDYYNLNTNKKKRKNITDYQLYTACEKVKKDLSFTARSDINPGKAYPNLNITKDRFDQLNNDFESIISPIKNILASANLIKSDIDEIIIMGGSTKIPKIHNLLENMFKDKQIKKHINPDECVAIGAAIKADMIAKEQILSNNNRKLGVCLLSLGIKSNEGLMAVMIKKDTPLPAKRTKTFQTNVDDQSVMSFAIYEGERPMADDNVLLQKFQIRNIPKGPRKTNSVDVTFEIETDGILRIHATEKTNGTEKKIEIIETTKDTKDAKRIIEEAQDETQKFKDNNKEKLAKAKFNLLDFCLQMKSELKVGKIKATDDNNETLVQKCDENLKLVKNGENANEDYYIALLNEMIKLYETTETAMED